MLTEKSWEYYVIGGLAGLVFLLLVTVIATICGLVFLRKRSVALRSMVAIACHGYARAHLIAIAPCMYTEVKVLNRY